MGPWDIMSQHFIERRRPPQGISSFTKIRLGWISPDQVTLVNPGATQTVFLAPLSKGGRTLAVKIPLSGRWSGGRRYYLVENRQPIGYDRLLPDCGILVLEVNPDVREGSGTVKVVDADPASPYFSHATFRLDRNRRNTFIDKKQDVAIIPLWPDKGTLGVLITTPEKAPDALRTALTIQQLLKRFPEPRGAGEQKAIEESIASFKRSDFKTCREIAQQRLERAW